ncbi:TetR/AcrR family transcriptional regulator [Rhodococcoides yunnanense]|uniref:TetR/AcrR family transcriptional regulator n=1 Tax=Rhodococcoides yunnanense TaxID=278209 RepID=UPI0009335264|nr:TetR/AcrR family transcriptional regulator [Rhodococcus yunnanensis]
MPRATDPTPAVAAKGSIREQQRAFTRDRLLQGAQEVFASKGYVASTIDEIATASGASRATFYLYFSTKLELITELGASVKAETHAFYEQLDDVLADGSRDALLDWMNRSVDWMDGHKVVLSSLDTAQVAEGSLSYEDALGLSDRMPRYLAGWREADRPQARMRIALLAAQFRAMFSFLLRTEDVRKDVSNAELAEAMTDVWMSALSSSPPDDV